jgi:pimeloyl-ACP methyl ester carboxylesterase
MINRQLIEGEEPHDIPKINPSTPLVFVPGILGSQLWEAGQQRRRIWPFWHWTAGRFRFESLKLLIEAPDKVATDVVPDVYAGLILALEKMGYILNHDFWSFPYDWTQSNEISGQQLASFIKRKINGKWGEADVICHSMGGIVTRAAHVLYQAPIRRTVCLSVPHLGAPRAFFALKKNINLDFFRLPGFVANFIWKKYARRLGDEKTLRRQLQWVGEQLQPIYELLPDQFYLTSEHSMVSVAYEMVTGGPDKIAFEERRPLIGVHATYFSDKFSKFGPTEQCDRIVKAMRFKESLGNKSLRDSLAIYSDSEATPDCVDRFIWCAAGQTPLGWRRPTDSGQHGDGVVPTDSAAAVCQQAKNIGGTHVGVPNSSRAHVQIAKCLGEF